MQSMAASENLNALFVGGMSLSRDIEINAKSKYAIIMRLDLEQNTWVWRKSFYKS